MSVATDSTSEDAPVFTEARNRVPRPVVDSSLIAASRQAESALHRLNALAAALIVAFLVLTPIPLGSNRPAFWMIWSVVVGLMATGYGVALLWMRAPARLSLLKLWPETLGFAALCLFIGIEALPIGRWLPDSIVHIDALGLRLPAISYDPGSTRLVLIQFFTFGLLFLLAAQIAVNRRRARRILFGIVIVIALFAGYGLVSLTYLGDTILGFDKEVYQGYATGTFINRNSFATYLAVGLALCVPLLIQAIAERRTLVQQLAEIALLLLCFAVIGGALLATGSRMGAVAALGGMFVAGALGLLVYRGSLLLGIGLVGIAIAAAVAGIAVFGMPLVERLVLLPGIDESRALLHQQVWEAILLRPWLGYGAGSLASVFPLFQHPPLSTEILWENTHSTYLALWFELGLVAGSVPLLIAAGLTLRALLALRDPSSTVTSLAAIGAVTVFAIHSLLDFSAEIEANAFLFTVILALGAAGAVARRTSSA